MMWQTFKQFIKDEQEKKELIFRLGIYEKFKAQREEKNWNNFVERERLKQNDKVKIITD